MKVNNKYGYKVLKNKKIVLITNSFELAVIKIKEQGISRYLIDNWQIKPIKNVIEYKWYWKGCPF